MGERQGIAQKGVHAIEGGKAAARHGKHASKTEGREWGVGSVVADLAFLGHPDSVQKSQNPLK